MVGFIIGLFVGAVLAVAIIGFLAIAAEDEPQMPKHPDPWSWYDDDGR